MTDPHHGNQGVAAPLIRVAGLSQSYGPVAVLDDVSFEVRPGEVHALLGANGAGKSTLIKVLAGLVPYTRGAIDVAGQALPRAATAQQLRDAGLAFVHQDLGLVDQMSVAENIALATGFDRRRGLIDFSSTARRAAAATASLGLDLDPDVLVGRLDQDAKVMVAVARAFALDARVIVLDEVSSSLPAPQVTRLLDAIRRSTESGLGYVYVTHRLDELFGLADTVTVLRDGRVAVQAPMAKVDKRRLVDAIVEAPEGTTGGELIPPDDPVPAHRDDSAEVDRPVRLSVSDLRLRAHADPISFSVQAGEIVAFCGLVGAGTRDVVRVLGGDTRPHTGQGALDGAPLTFGNAAAMRDSGCSYVPGDRQREGVISGMTIKENLFLSRRGGLGRPGNEWVRSPRSERRLSVELADLVELRPTGSVERPMQALSGGNQQKVVCARALRVAPRLLVLDDPTAGVDIGSRAQIHHLVQSAARDGSAVVFASTDYEEVAHLADRAMVVVAGSVVAELAGPELTEASLARASYGGDV